MQHTITSGVKSKQVVKHEIIKDCNICAKPFSARSRFEYFCQHCRAVSDLYRFGDWLDQGHATMDVAETPSHTPLKKVA